MKSGSRAAGESVEGIAQGAHGIRVHAGRHHRQLRPADPGMQQTTALQIATTAPRREQPHLQPHRDLRKLGGEAQDLAAHRGPDPRNRPDIPHP